MSKWGYPTFNGMAVLTEVLENGNPDVADFLYKFQELLTAAVDDYVSNNGPWLSSDGVQNKILASVPGGDVSNDLLNTVIEDSSATYAQAEAYGASVYLSNIFRCETEKSLPVLRTKEHYLESAIDFSLMDAVAKNGGPSVTLADLLADLEASNATHFKYASASEACANNKLLLPLAKQCAAASALQNMCWLLPLANVQPLPLAPDLTLSLRSLAQVPALPRPHGRALQHAERPRRDLRRGSVRDQRDDHHRRAPARVERNIPRQCGLHVGRHPSRRRGGRLVPIFPDHRRRTRLSHRLRG